MTAQPGDRQIACATLMYLAQPANPLLGGLLRVFDSADVLADQVRYPAAAGAATLDAAHQVDALVRARPAGQQRAAANCQWLWLPWAGAKQHQLLSGA